MAPYYESSVCEVEILADNSVKLQLKGHPDSASTVADFSVDQLRETVKFGQGINEILGQEPKPKLVNDVLYLWEVWRTFPSFKGRESKSNDDDWRSLASNTEFSQSCENIRTAIEQKDTTLSKANALNPNDSAYHMIQRARVKLEAKFESEWEGFMAELFPSRNDLIAFLRGFTPERIEEDFYSAELYETAQALFGHYIRIIVMNQFDRTMAGAASKDGLHAKEQYLPSWATLADAYGKAGVNPPKSWLLVCETFWRLSRVVNVLAMLEQHLTPAVLKDLSAKYSEVTRNARLNNEASAQDEIFGLAVELLQTIGPQFCFTLGKMQL